MKLSTPAKSPIEPSSPADGLPPGPAAAPMAQSLAFARDPVRALLAARERYGPIFTLRFMSAGPMVVVADPDEAETVINSDPSVGHAGEARRSILPQASSRSMFGGDGEPHRRARESIAPAFDPGRIARQEDAMKALTETHLRSWPIGRAFRLLPRMRLLAEEIFVRLVLGVSNDAPVTALVAAMRRLLWTPGNPPLLPPDRDAPILGPSVHWIFRRRLKPVAELLAKEIDVRRATSPKEDGILDLLAHAEPLRTTAEIVDELAVVLAAAQEPPSIALTWILERLGRSPQLAEEFMAVDCTREQRQRIVDETLRLRPPAMASLRRLTAPAELLGHGLPAGTMTMVPIPLLHRDPNVYPDPARFRPNRFVDGGRPAAFRPFGGGARRCIGEALAQAEIHTIVPTILGRLRLRPFWPRPERPVQRATVLVPHRSLVMIAAGARP